MNLTKRRFLLDLAPAIAPTIALGLMSGQAWARLSPYHTGGAPRGGLEGFDAVAYFEAGRPVRGLRDLRYRWQETDWYFATSANLTAFRRMPERYAPQFGGYCAYAVSRGYTARGHPEAWTVYNGRLYMNFNLAVRATWLKARDANIEKAESNWPAVLTSSS